MDTKLVFAVGFLVLFIVIFFTYSKWLRKDLNSLINKGILYHSVTMKRYLNTMSFVFIITLVVSFIFGYVLG